MRGSFRQGLLVTPRLLTKPQHRTFIGGLFKRRLGFEEMEKKVDDDVMKKREENSDSDAPVFKSLEAILEARAAKRAEARERRKAAFALTEEEENLYKTSAEIWGNLKKFRQRTPYQQTKVHQTVIDQLNFMKTIDFLRLYVEDNAYDEDDDFDPFMDRNKLLKILREYTDQLELEEHEIRVLVDQAQTLDIMPNLVSFVEVLNLIQIQCANKFGQQAIVECFEKGSPLVTASQMKEVLDKHIGTPLDAKALIELERLVIKDEGSEGIIFERLISMIVENVIKTLPKPEVSDHRESGALKFDALANWTSTLGQTFESKGRAMVMESGMKATETSKQMNEAMKGTMIGKFKDWISREIWYIEEYFDKLGGTTADTKEQRRKRLERRRGGFDRDAYMANVKALEEKLASEEKKGFSVKTDAEREADAEASTAAEEGGEAPKSEGESEGGETPKLDGEEGRVGEKVESAVEGEEAAKPEITALMTKEEVKTVWEKRLDQWGDRLQSWKVYRDARNAKRQIEASDNPVVKGAMEKVREAKDMAEDAREVWETSQHPLVWKARDISDSMFGETEQGFATSEIKRIAGDYSEQELVSELRGYMIPIVIEAFLRGDLEFLRTLSGGAAEAAFHQAITQRKTLGQVLDSQILGVSHVDIAKVALENGEPQLTVSFVCQHVHCVRDASGTVVEGAPGSIQGMQYMWNIQRAHGNSDFDWEIQFFGMQQTVLI